MSALKYSENWKIQVCYESRRNSERGADPCPDFLAISLTSDHIKRNIFLKQTKFIHFSYSVVDPQFQFIDIWIDFSLKFSKTEIDRTVSSPLNRLLQEVMYIYVVIFPLLATTAVNELLSSLSRGVPSQIRINVVAFLVSNSLLI